MWQVSEGKKNKYYSKNISTAYAAGICSQRNICLYTKNALVFVYIACI